MLYKGLSTYCSSVCKAYTGMAEYLKIMFWGMEGMYLHSVAPVFKKSYCKTSCLCEWYGENFTTSVQTVHQLQLRRLMFASSSPQWCCCALSMSNCAIIRQNPEYLPPFHSLFNRENHSNGHNYQSLHSCWCWEQRTCCTSPLCQSSSLIALPFSRAIIRLAMLICIKDALCVPEISSRIREHIKASNQSNSCPVYNFCAS